MKQIRTFLPLTVLLLAAAMLPAAARAAEPRLITVTGNAAIRIVPDEVILTFGVETIHKELAAAKKENDQKIRAIIQFVKDQEIEGKYIQTDYINIEPRYRNQHEHSEFVGYFVRKTIVVTLRDISKFEAVLSGALESGANYVHGVQFQTTELRKHRDKARTMAIKAAREKASSMAGELGQEIGKPHTIHEGHTGWTCGYNSHWGTRRGAFMAQNSIQEIPLDAQTDGSIALGQIEVNAAITVTFEME